MCCMERFIGNEPNELLINNIIEQRNYMYTITHSIEKVNIGHHMDIVRYRHIPPAILMFMLFSYILYHMIQQKVLHPAQQCAIRWLMGKN